MYDIFISYRRDGGHEMARLIYEHLRLRGLNCFFDLEELGSGEFNVKLLDNIAQSANFVLVLSPNSLDRCINSEDWVRTEIEHAIKLEKNIVPIIMEGFVWPSNLPQELSKLPFYNGVQFIRAYFDASVTKLFSMLTIERPLSDPAQKGSASNTPNITLRLKRAWVFLESSEWKKADNYAEKVLDVDPENGEAYLVKLLAELKVNRREDLGKLKEPFWGSTSYQSILRYACDSLKQEMDKALEKIQNAAKHTYDTALATADSAKTAEDYRKVSQIFSSIGWYQNASALSKKYWEKANKIAYEKAVKIMKKAKTKNEFAEAAALFDSLVFSRIHAYKDSEVLSKECKLKVEMYEKISTGHFSPTGHLYFQIKQIDIPQGVTKIGEFAFSRWSALESITIPDSVTSIGEWAFSDCSALKSITIPDSVTSIGICAFKGCSALESITIPDSVTSIGDDAFEECFIKEASAPAEVLQWVGNEKLEAVTITGGDKIPDCAFANCSALKSITIPDSITSIGSNAFYKCTSLTSVTIPDSVTSIGEFAFYECSALQSITIPDSVTFLGRSAFDSCTTLYSVKLPKALKTISERLFYDCTNLTPSTFEIPKSVTSIEQRAFMGCKLLDGLLIPTSVKTIGDFAFHSSVNLSKNRSVPGPTIIVYEGCRQQWIAIEKGKSIHEVKAVVNFLVNSNEITSAEFPQQDAPYQNHTLGSYTWKTTSTGNSIDNPLNASQSRGCYIATCVYGSYDCPEVWTLRRYRDNTLGCTWYGRLFIKTYYAISPTLVKWFGKTKWFKKLWRGKLDKMVKKLLERGVENTPYSDKEW